jgi:hypothetical protein
MPCLLGIQEANLETQLTSVIVFLTWYWDADKSVMSNFEGHHAGVCALRLEVAGDPSRAAEVSTILWTRCIAMFCDDGAAILTFDIRYAS